MDFRQDSVAAAFLGVEFNGVPCLDECGVHNLGGCCGPTMHRDSRGSEIRMRQGITGVERDRPFEHLAGALVLALCIGSEVGKAAEQTVVCGKACGRYP